MTQAEWIISSNLSQIAVHKQDIDFFCILNTKVINQRNTVSSSRNEANFVPILDEDDPSTYNNELITPIIAEGDVLGAIVFLSVDKKMGEVEDKLAQTAAGFLGKQMEQ